MTKYWILIASKNHVMTGVAGSFAQAGHGKSYPLRRMQVGDGIIYYSPKLEYGGKEPYQRFTAIGCVTGEKVYRFDMGNEFTPHRRDVKYLSSRDIQVVPLVGRLSFIKDKVRWGNIFKFGIIQIPAEDFKLIATMMNANLITS
jgi:hypothetical protein